jgi:2-oxoisovalerate dehydrogenase E1 component
VIYREVPALIESIRAGHGPVLIEAQVVRIDPHSSSDDHRKYRCVEDLESCVGHDPLLYVENQLLETGALTQSDIDRLRHEIRAEVDAAADWADGQPEPNGRDLLGHIYAAGSPEAVSQAPRYLSREPVALIDAINHGLREEMARNPRTICGAKTSQIRKAEYSK